MKQLFVGVRYLELIDCACYLRSLGVTSITLCVHVLWGFCTRTQKRLKDESYQTTALLRLKRNRMSSSRCLCGFELHGCIKTFGTLRFRM